jgi:hypothetical protein
MHQKYLKKGYCKGPLDFPCTSEVARELEAQLKEAEKDGFTYQRSFVTKAVSEFVDGERADVSVVTDDSIDRDSEVVIAKGLDLKQFRKNPVVAWAHQYDQLPVGRAEWIKADGNSIKAKTVYAKRPEGMEGPFFPDSVWALVQQGMLPGKSIGFLPREASAPSVKEIELRPELASVRTVIRKATMFEYSIAPVPSNPNALATAVAKGLLCPPWMLEQLGIDEQRAAIEEAEEIVKASIVWDDEDFVEPKIKMPTFSRSIDDLQQELKSVFANYASGDLLDRIRGRA